MRDVRPAAVAGMFYPGVPAALAASVRECLVEAATRPRAGGARPKALIVPHAGYVYSGPIAAAAYARLARSHATIRRVVLLGPTHRVAVRGLALPSARAFVDAARRSRDRSQGRGARADPAAGRSRTMPRTRSSTRSRSSCRSCRRCSTISASCRSRSATATPEEVADVHRAAVGRPGDADPRELRPLALSPLRRRARDRPRQRGRASSRSRQRSTTSRRAARRRSTASRFARGGTGSCPSCSTSATRATRPATARASSAMPRSHSPREAPMRGS